MPVHQTLAVYSAEFSEFPHSDLSIAVPSLVAHTVAIYHSSFTALNFCRYCFAKTDTVNEPNTQWIGKRTAFNNRRCNQLRGISAEVQRVQTQWRLDKMATAVAVVVDDHDAATAGNAADALAECDRRRLVDMTTLTRSTMAGPTGIVAGISEAQRSAPASRARQSRRLSRPSRLESKHWAAGLESEPEFPCCLHICVPEPPFEPRGVSLRRVRSGRFIRMV